MTDQPKNAFVLTTNSSQPILTIPPGPQLTWQATEFRAHAGDFWLIVSRVSDELWNAECLAAGHYQVGQFPSFYDAIAAAERWVTDIAK